MTTPTAADLVSVRIMREEEWCYDRRSAKLPPRRIAEQSMLPRDEGGLGYYLSPQMVRSRIAAYHERMIESLDESVEERIATELADLDMLQRAVLRQMAVDEREGERLDVNMIRTAAALGEQRRKLLGLDAETKSRVTVVNSSEVDEAVAKLAAELGAS